MTTAPVIQAVGAVGVANLTQDLSYALSGLGTISSGDTILAICVNPATATITTWSQQAGPTMTKKFEDGTAAGASSVWRRVCDGTESGTLTIRRSSTTNNSIMVVMRITGADTTEPFQAAVSGSGSGTTISLGALTAAVANTLSVQEADFQSVNSGQTWTPNSGQTLKQSGQATGQGVTYMLGYANIAASGSTGAQQWTHSSSVTTKGVHVLINPAPDVVPIKTVIAQGAKKTVVGPSVIVQGAKKTIASASVIVGGAKKTIV